jgi:hypothetical protein
MRRGEAMPRPGFEDSIKERFPCDIPKLRADIA